ncbi:T-cell surface antigen CD2-like [Pristis pectinata]|uniref:T-cell surface antigen CD2-like n=1 Tax=Pristis pectinata TaxID=685728 RepID=UPI00223D0F3C|nr:T-cell surface antigen CD2-like [Pristis pectinata]
MIWYQKYSRQLNLIFLLAASGVFPTASGENVAMVYSELGTSAFLSTPSKISFAFNEIKWSKGNLMVARYKGDSKAYGNFTGRVEVFQNATLKFNSTTETDEGTYLCEMYKNDGKKEYVQHFKLSLLVKVSKPALNISCNSPKEVNIICSVENGTNVSLTLHDDSLHQTVQGHHLTKIFSFKRTGNRSYFCIAKNKISEAKTVKMHHCADNETPIDYIKIMILAGIIAVAMIISFLLICLIRKCRSQRQRRVSKLTPSQNEWKEPTEINYVNQPMPSTPDPREHHVEYSNPHPRPRPQIAQKGGERMYEEKGAYRAERTHGGRRGPREERSPRGGTTPREKAHQGDATQRGGRAPKMETKEPRGGRGPLPKPPE